MGSKFKFELNKKGVGELLKSNEMQAHLSKVADRVNSGHNYEIKEFVGFDRAHVMIKAVDPDDVRDALDNNALEKALDIVRR